MVLSDSQNENLYCVPSTMESTKEMYRVTFTGGAQEPEKNDCNHFFSAQHLLYCEEAAEGV